MTDILVPEFVKGILIFLRIVGVLMTSPFFNNSSFSNTQRMFLALIITYMVYFFAPDIDAIYYEDFLMMSLAGIKEVITGLLIGFSINLIFHGISFAGFVVGYDMGLMIAQTFDPTTESTTNIIGQILVMVGTLVFIIINGPHFIIRALSYSYQIIPIGFYTINEEMFKILIQYSASIFLLAIKIAAPILVSFFLLDLGAGIIARVLPQMNVFFVVAPLKIALGMGLLMAVLPVYVYVIKNLLLDYENSILKLIQAMSING